MSIATIKSHTILDTSLPKTEHHCKVTECPPFGLTRTCRAVSILQLLHLVNDCQLSLPSLNLGDLLTITKLENLKNFIDTHFSITVPAPEETFYVNSEAYIKSLRELSTKLASAAPIYTEFILCLRRDEYLPSDGMVLKAFGNLHLLHEFANTKRMSMERTLLKALDDYPEITETRLRIMMEEAEPRGQLHSSQDPFIEKIPNLSVANFSSLGVGCWVDDEVMNYFIKKWCGRSTAKSGTLTVEDERKVLRWCAKRLDSLCIDRWDSVFIPINENRTHWYSAYIDFRLKRIEIFDSLETTCTVNREKPLAHQKNTKLMLVLMWLAEVLGRLRGEPVLLKNDPETVWRLTVPASLRYHFNRIATTAAFTVFGTSAIFFNSAKSNRDWWLKTWHSPTTWWASAQDWQENYSGTVIVAEWVAERDNRNLHLELKRDKAHRKYMSLQARNVSRQFSNTVDTASLAAATASSQTFAPSDTQLTNPPNPVRAEVWGHYVVDDVDVNMEVDQDNIEGHETDDAEGSIDIQMGEVEEMKDESFAHALDTAAEIMLEHADRFNFLPDSAVVEDVSSDAEKGDAEKGDTINNTSTYRRMNRSLLEDNEESRTYHWHPTAGKMYGRKPDIYLRWKRLFSSDKADPHESYRPFSSRLEWELAQWVIQEKVSHSSFNRLLQIPEIKDKLGLSYASTRAMLDKVDQIPERCGAWYTKELAFKDRPDEKFTVRHRNPVEAIKALWGDPALSKHLVFKPAKLFRGNVQSEDERIFSEMWTGAYWNAAQQRIPEGGTIAPVVIATDKTQLTQFSGNKSAYPVYLTIGNVPKALRRKPGTRACILIAYLSIDKPAKTGLSKTTLKLRNYELFHCSMAMVLEPLKAAGNPDGDGVEMIGGDGAVRKTTRSSALSLCTKYGTCPKCQRKADELQLSTPGEPRTQSWTTMAIRSARRDMGGKGDSKIHSRTMQDDIAGGNFDPFWTGFPLTDIHRCISPDVLHQLHLGILKYLVSWVQEVVGEEELDRRIRILPMSNGVRRFVNGISVLSQASGTEYKHIARILLTCLVGKVNSKGMIAVRSLLHFMQLAQYPSHDQETLDYMKAELDTWHKHRSYFIETGCRLDFNIPKFHSLLHYVDSIRWLGTTDNYNTESFERLHIDFAKEGWRASNKRDHFPQMIRWLSRREKISSYDFYQSWVKSQDSNSGQDEVASTSVDGALEEESFVLKRIFTGAQTNTQAIFHLAKTPQEPPGQQASRTSVLQNDLPFTTLDVWHQYKFAPVKLLQETEQETLKAIPATRTNLTPRFDTVIVLDSDEAESTAVEAVFRYGFSVPAPDNWPKVPLAYVTWYTRFKGTPDQATGMYRLEPAFDSRRQLLSTIISLSDIRQGCMLVPSRTQWEDRWTSENVLDQCSSFFSGLLYQRNRGLITVSTTAARSSLVAARLFRPQPQTSSLWSVCTEVASYIDQGQRLENLSWELWHLQGLIVDSDNVNSKREFKKLSKHDKLDKEKGWQSAAHVCHYQQPSESRPPNFRRNHFTDMLGQSFVAKSAVARPVRTQSREQSSACSLRSALISVAPVTAEPVKKPVLKPSSESNKRLSSLTPTSTMVSDDVKHAKQGEEDDQFGLATLLNPSAPTLTTSMNYGEGLKVPKSANDTDNVGIPRPIIELPLDECLNENITNTPSLFSTTSLVNSDISHASESPICYLPDASNNHNDDDDDAVFLLPPFGGAFGAPFGSFNTSDADDSSVSDEEESQTTSDSVNLISTSTTTTSSVSSIKPTLKLVPASNKLKASKARSTTPRPTLIVRTSTSNPGADGPASASVTSAVTSRSNASTTVPLVSGNSTTPTPFTSKPPLKSAGASFKAGRGTAATMNNLNNIPGGQKAECSNCGATHAPLWRRGLNDELICNACGLYCKLHQRPRPKTMRNRHGKGRSANNAPRPETVEVMAQCYNCHTTATPLWRKDDEGKTMIRSSAGQDGREHAAARTAWKFGVGLLQQGTEL
ncbi:hypothetical protein D9757_014286 [Collybiopsis confluens]|uniref:GATA-type domain-containing protein n=1 Tax=Collybiopsis confluens TaxID=2823264 RepID=A0A8H5CRL4_9AGAR|nr:hypothetical protein D9757_014286 [Collybiopsis confluens]